MGLWDYDVYNPDDDALNDEKAQSSPKEAPVDVDGDEEDASKPTKKRGRPSKKSDKALQPSPKKNKAMQNLAKASSVCLISDDEEEDENDGFLVAMQKKSAPISHATLDDDDDDDSPLCSPSVPVKNGSAITSGLSEVARKALQQSDLMRQQLKSVMSQQLTPEAGQKDTSGAAHASIRIPKKGAPALKLGREEEEELQRLMKEGLAEEEEQDAHRTAAHGGASTSATMEEDGSAGDKISLICQCNKGKIQIKICATDVFERLQADFVIAAAAKGWMPKGSDVPPGFKLVFDGSKISASKDSPEALGMEDGDVIDISWK